MTLKVDLLAELHLLKFKLDQKARKRKDELESLELVRPENERLKPYITGRLEEARLDKRMIDELILKLENQHIE